MSLHVRARSRALLAVAAVAASGATSASALTIRPIFDSSITSLANAATVEAAFTTVANQFDAAFSTPVTIKIGVSWGKVNGSSLGTGNIAASQSSLTGPFAYSDIVDAFQANAAANPGDANMVSAAANLPTISPAGSLSYELPYAEAQALGYLPASINPNSGYVGFSSAVKWDFNGADGVTAGAYDFQGLAAHEISEVLGRITGLHGTQPTYATMFDALRYAAAHVSSFSFSSAAYLSVDGGVTNLGQFNLAGSGDRSDLYAIKGDAQDAALSSGTLYGLSNSDLIALDVLGWGSWAPTGSGGAIGSLSPSAISHAMSTPEPSTWMMLLLGFGLVGAAARRAPRLA
ncbi:MAG: Ca2+-binding protein toxin [Caulobacteraceae bacterium]|nr:Ca2+-binding protein toxin [Caulobacteraceae bacterium]